MITSPPISVTNVSSEATVIFRCEAKGTPLPDISWIIDNVTISTVSN